MEMRAHIEFPETGIEFSELKKIFSVLEETCKNYAEDEFDARDGKVVSVRGGSIWFDFILPIAKSVLPYALKFFAKKLMAKSKRNRRIDVKIETETSTIHINIEE